MTKHRRRTERRGSRSRLVVSVLLAMVIPASLPVSAGAQTQPLRIDVRRGLEGISRAFSPNPLTIVVEADTFFSGWIEVIAPNSTEATARYRQALELPAGSRKTIIMTTPRSTINQVRAIASDGSVRANGQVPAENVLRKGEPLVGVLSQEAPRLGSIEVPILAQAATVVPVSATMLSLGWAGLNPLSHLVVDGALLPSLSPEQLGAMTSFAAGGGELIVAAGDEGDLGKLNEKLRDAASQEVHVVRVGSGRITAATAPLSDDEWSADGALWKQTLRPVDIVRWTRGNSRNRDLGQALRETGGFRRPTLGWLLFFVLAYVALVGPINFMVLSRMRRRELAWLTIPAVSVVFSLGAYIAGVGFRDIPDLQGVALRVFEDGGQQSEIALGVVPRSGSEASVKLDGPWTAEPYTLISTRREGQRIDFGRNSITARFDLSSGEVGTVVASRSTPGEQVVAGRIRIERNRYVGTLTNPLGSELRSPRLFAGPASLSLGASLPPGGSRDATLDIFSNEGSLLTGSNSEGEFGMGMSGPGPELDEPPSLYRRAGAVAGLGRPGFAYLTGWVPLEDARDELGVGAAKGQTLVLVPVQIDDPQGGALAQTVRATMVSTDGEFNEVGGFDGFGGLNAMIQNARSTVVRFQLPGGSRPDRLRLRSDGPNPWGGNQRFVKRRLREGPAIEKPEGPTLEGPIAVPEPAPPEFRAIDGESLNPQAYDFSSDSWVDLSPRADGTVLLGAKQSRRYLTDEGEIYLRVLSEFGQVFTTSMFTLEGVTA